MANETLYSSNITLAAAIDAGIQEPWLGFSIMPKLVSVHNPGTPNTRTLDIPKSGTVVSSVLAEAVAGTLQVVTDTKVTMTIQKAAVFTGPTVEAIKFASGANIPRHQRLAALAHAKKFDTDCLSLATGLSQSVDAGTTMTVEKLMEAAFLVESSNVPSASVAAVLARKQRMQLGTDIRDNAASFYGNGNFNTTITNAQSGNGGFTGNLFGVDTYVSPNVAVDTAPTPDEYVGMVFAPDFCIAALFPSGNSPEFQSDISGDVMFLEGVVVVRTYMWYQVAELNDLAGCALRSDIS